jgi:hypothetical protein
VHQCQCKADLLFASMRWPALQIVTVAIAVRVVLVLTGIGRYFATRIEVSTPENGILPVKEGIALLRLGLSPYSGSTSHVPPLVLWAFSGFAEHDLAYAVPSIVSDVLAAFLLRKVMQMTSEAASGHQAGEDGICTMMSCAALHAPCT